MARSKGDPKVQKAKRQKIFAVVGAVILLAALGFAVPRTMSMLGEPPEYADPASAPASAPSAGTPAGTAPADGLSISVTAPGSTGELPDRNVEPEAAQGQLVSFELFQSKDPFVQQVLPDPGGSGPAPEEPASGKPQQQPQPGDSAGAGAPGPAAAPGPGDPPPVAVELPPPTSAVISVNGQKETVQPKAEFPEAEPTFVLVAVRRRYVRIGIAGGSLASGAETIKLRRGKTVTLVNTADGTEFKLKLISVS